MIYWSRRVLRVIFSPTGTTKLMIGGEVVTVERVTRRGGWSAWEPWPGESFVTVDLDQYMAAFDRVGNPRTVEKEIAVTLRNGAEVLATGTVELTFAVSYHGGTLRSHTVTAENNPEDLALKVTTHVENAREGEILFRHPGSGATAVFTYAFAKDFPPGTLDVELFPPWL